MLQRGIFFLHLLLIFPPAFQGNRVPGNSVLRIRTKICSQNQQRIEVLFTENTFVFLKSDLNSKLKSHGPQKFSMRNLLSC